MKGLHRGLAGLLAACLFGFIGAATPAHAADSPPAENPKADVGETRNTTASPPRMASPRPNQVPSGAVKCRPYFDSKMSAGRLQPDVDPAKFLALGFINGHLNAGR